MKRLKVAIVYNAPETSRYSTMGEDKAVLGVLEEVEAVYRALIELGYPAVKLPLSPPMSRVEERLEKLGCEMFFNLFEGFEGQPETEVQFVEILEQTGKPYTGCPPSALSLALDKARAKALLKSSGVETPAYQILSPQTLSSFYLSYPCIVKPCREDASHGLREENVVRDSASLKNQVLKVSEHFGGEALVEEFINGREFNATVMGNGKPVVLPVSEISYSLPASMPRLLTFAAKWEPESLYFRGTKAVCPAETGVDLRKQIAKTCLGSFKLLGCRGYARVDMRMNSEGKLFVLEVNPNPDISPGSGAALQAAAAGMGYSQFIERIVHLALSNVGAGFKPAPIMTEGLI